LCLNPVESLDDAIAEVFNLFKYQADTNKIEYYFVSEVEENLEIDIFIFKILIFILLQNSFKFTKQG